MKNKELLEKLKDYYLTQDHEIICKILASATLDLHRFMKIEKLPLEELESLKVRTLHLSKQLNDFASNGPTGDIKFTVSNSEKKC